MFVYVTVGVMAHFNFSVGFKGVQVCFGGAQCYSNTALNNLYSSGLVADGEADRERRKYGCLLAVKWFSCPALHHQAHSVAASSCFCCSNRPKHTLTASEHTRTPHPLLHVCDPFII